MNWRYLANRLPGVERPDAGAYDARGRLVLTPAERSERWAALRERVRSMRVAAIQAGETPTIELPDSTPPSDFLPAALDAAPVIVATLPSSPFEVQDQREPAERDGVTYRDIPAEDAAQALGRPHDPPSRAQRRARAIAAALSGR